MGAERLVRGFGVATLSAPLLVLTQLVTGATGPSPRVLLAALLAVTAVAALLDGAGTSRTALATGLAQLAGYAVLAQAAPGGGDGCLPAVGRGAGVLLGVDVPAGGCVTAGPYTLVGGAVTAVMVAAGIVLSHAVLAGLGARLIVLTGGAVRLAGTVARAATTVAIRMLPQLPRPVTGTADLRTPPPAAAAPRPLPADHPARRPSRRGPPAPPVPLPG